MFCGEVFSNQYDFQTHILERHHLFACFSKAQLVLQCEECSFACLKEIDLKRHFMIIHENITPIKCHRLFCEEVFANRYQLRQHILVDHENRFLRWLRKVFKLDCFGA